MISLTFLYTTPAFASAGAIVGSVDVFNGTQISGWAYETASPLSSPDILLKITNTVTGETVSEIPAKPDSKRNDLVSQVGEEGTPAFTATVDLSNLADGTYSAAAYKDGQKFTNSVYYTKGNAAAATDGRTAHLLGTLDVYKRQLLILCFVFRRFFYRFINIGIGHVGTGCDCDVLLFSCSQILGRHVYLSLIHIYRISRSRKH